MLKFLLQQGVLLLIKLYNKFGKAKAYKEINNFYKELDLKLENKLGKEETTKIQKEIIELLEENIKEIKNNLN